MPPNCDKTPAEKEFHGTDVDQLTARLSRAGIYPAHGWVESPAEPSKAYVFVPFVGCAIREQLAAYEPGGQSGTENPAKDKALLAFRCRLPLFLRSLELWASSASDLYGNHRFELLMCCSDLALYEFGCLADALAKLLAFFVCDRPDQVKTRSFSAFRKWAIDSVPDSLIGRALVASSTWYDEWRGSAAGKGARDQRTHHHWEYRAWSNPSERWLTLNLVGRTGAGKTGKCDVIGLLQEVTHGLFSFLGAITPLSQGEGYIGCDVLASEGECREYPVAHWLEVFVPHLSVAKAVPSDDT